MPPNTNRDDIVQMYTKYALPLHRRKSRADKKEKEGGNVVQQTPTATPPKPIKLNRKSQSNNNESTEEQNAKRIKLLTIDENNSNCNAAKRTQEDSSMVGIL